MADGSLYQMLADAELLQMSEEQERKMMMRYEMNAEQRARANRRERHKSRRARRLHAIERWWNSPIPEDGQADEDYAMQLAHDTIEGDLADLRVSEELRMAGWWIATNGPVSFGGSRREAERKARTAANYFGYEVDLIQTSPGNWEPVNRRVMESLR